MRSPRPTKVREATARTRSVTDLSLVGSHGKVVRISSSSTAWASLLRKAKEPSVAERQEASESLANTSTLITSGSFGGFASQSRPWPSSAASETSTSGRGISTAPRVASSNLRLDCSSRVFWLPWSLNSFSSPTSSSGSC